MPRDFKHKVSKTFPQGYLSLNNCGLVDSHKFYERAEHSYGVHIFFEDMRCSAKERIVLKYTNPFLK